MPQAHLVKFLKRIQMPFLYVANWKMNMSFLQAMSFAKNNYTQLLQLSENASIVLCPSYITIHSLATIFNNTSVAIGAQNCSQYPKGAYTGEVSALDLKEAGVSYCIIGHQERRLLFGETNEEIAKKMEQLVGVGIQPIICVGEPADTQQEDIIPFIITQLRSIIPVAAHHQIANLIIAYEPGSAIGSGQTPANNSIEKVFEHIQHIFLAIPSVTLTLLYGGSVNAAHASHLKKIHHLGGFLIGNASTNFQSFEKIVSLE